MPLARETEINENILAYNFKNTTQYFGGKSTCEKDFL